MFGSRQAPPPASRRASPCVTLATAFLSRRAVDDCFVLCFWTLFCRPTPSFPQFPHCSQRGGLPVCSLFLGTRLSRRSSSVPSPSTAWRPPSFRRDRRPFGDFPPFPKPLHIPPSSPSGRSLLVFPARSSGPPLFLFCLTVFDFPAAFPGTTLVLIL